ncbi:MAG: hypothetical protein ACE5NA_00790 [Nitrospiraceae bacterium]
MGSSDAATALDRIPVAMRDPIQRYADSVRELAGANVLALTVFGSLAAGSFNPTKHTARSVVVLQTVDLEMLRQFAKQGARLGKARIAAPLIMTPEYIRASADSFPLEFIEIHQCHVCVFGPDYFNDLVFDAAHIRLQCERELKTILIGMRQGLLAAAGREKLFSTIETDVAERLVRTLRGLLWLHGQTQAQPGVQAVAEVERSVSRPMPGIRRILDETAEHGWQEFRALYADVEALQSTADAW